MKNVEMWFVHNNKYPIEGIGHTYYMRMLKHYTKDEDKFFYLIRYSAHKTYENLTNERIKRYVTNA